MLQWQEIDTVFLDMDGTLLDLHFDSHFWLEFLPARYAEIHQIDVEEAKKYILSNIMAEQGTLNWYCFDYWSERFQLPIVELKHEVADKIGYRHSVPEFLAWLKQSGRRVLIVTNSHRAGVDLKFARTNLADEVDGVVSSHDYGYPKEAQAFWETLMKHEPFDPERTLMVDDSLPVLQSAHDFGIKHLLTIDQPDLQMPPRDMSDCDFMSINDFNEVMVSE